MDWFNSPGFSSGVNHATYSRKPDGKYNRNGSGSWTLKGFIYERQQVVTDNIITVDIDWGYSVGWSPANVSCQNATRWYNVYDGIGGNQVATPTTNRICDDVPASIDLGMCTQ